MQTASEPPLTAVKNVAADRSKLGLDRFIVAEVRNMDIYEAIEDRRSIREYTAEAVDEMAVRRIIDAAVHAPNAMNRQPWSFTVIRDRAVLDRIARDAKFHALANMPHTEHLRTLLQDPDFHIFYHAPALIVISAVDAEPWIIEDCALAAENLMLAAHAEGLGTCWIGFAQSYLNSPEGKGALKLAAGRIPLAPIIVGHAADIPQAGERKPPEIVWIG